MAEDYASGHQIYGDFAARKDLSDKNNARRFQNIPLIKNKPEYRQIPARWAEWRLLIAPVRFLMRQFFKIQICP
jgi:hypothetical protein